MKNTDGKVSATTLIGIGLATLIFAAVVLSAGHSFALREVCAASERFSTAALAAIIASAISMIFLIWGAVRERTRRNILVAVTSTLVSLGLIAYAGFLILAFAYAERAADVHVTADNGVHFIFTEGFRVSSLRVVGPTGRWSIKATDEKHPPLSQSVRRYTLGETPAGYAEQESSIKYDGALPDGEYRVEATVLCAYRPAIASFTINQGVLQNSRFR